MQAPTLEWDASWQYDGMPELGGIYTQPVKVELDGYIYTLEFRVGDGRTIGILFVSVGITYPVSEWEFPETQSNYSLGQFRTNEGAIKFAQFAFNNFRQETKWDVCPSFQPLDYIQGVPYTYDDQEIVSDLI